MVWKDRGGVLQAERLLRTKIRRHGLGWVLVDVCGVEECTHVLRE